MLAFYCATRCARDLEPPHGPRNGSAYATGGVTAFHTPRVSVLNMLSFPSQSQKRFSSSFEVPSDHDACYS